MSSQQMFGHFSRTPSDPFGIWHNCRNCLECWLGRSSEFRDMAVGKNERLHFVSSTTFKSLVLFDIEFWLMAHFEGISL